MHFTIAYFYFSRSLTAGVIYKNNCAEIAINKTISKHFSIAFSYFS